MGRTSKQRRKLAAREKSSRRSRHDFARQARNRAVAEIRLRNAHPEGMDAACLALALVAAHRRGPRGAM